MTERQRGLEELLRMPVDGGDWAECERRCREVVAHLEGTLSEIRGRSNHHPYFMAELRPAFEEFGRYGKAPEEYGAARAALDEHPPGADPVWDFWREWVAARWRKAVKTVGDAFRTVPYVFSYQVGLALDRLRGMAAAEGLDVKRSSPELTAWLRKRQAGGAAARKGLSEAGYGDPAARLQAFFEELQATPRTDDSYGVLREFDFGRARLVILDEARDPTYDRKVVQRFLEVYRQLKRAGLERVWYGPLLYVSREQGKLTGEELVAAREAGYDISSYSGLYEPSQDTVFVHGYPDEAVNTLAHELGHRYWYRFLTRAQRLWFQDQVRTRPAEFPSPEARQKYLDTMDYFPGEVDDDGDLKPVEPVSNYGGTNAHEAFAEAFMFYVRGMPMDPAQRASFRRVLGLR